jgi:uncharacterized membrane-anchored protein YjiN (DUF445 family)
MNFIEDIEDVLKKSILNILEETGPVTENELNNRLSLVMLDIIEHLAKEVKTIQTKTIQEEINKEQK